jgi:hypothetical protein
MPLTTVDQGLLSTNAQYTGFKNRLINGDMVIDQRNNGASVTITNTGSATYTVDRWFAYGSLSSRFSVQQNAGSVTPPVGFTNYLGATSISTTSTGTGEQFILGQYIEGFNVADLGWGTTDALTVTLSFWVRSSLTGTFGGSLMNAAFNRSYPFTYTINAANTWEYKTITVAGDTTGTWLRNNSTGLRLHFGLGVGTSLSGTAGAWASSTLVSATGAVSVVGTNGATFYVTGCQLERGQTATSFDVLPYTTELALCQRYLPAWTAPGGAEGLLASGTSATSTVSANVFIFPVTTRVPPTGIVAPAASKFQTLFRAAAATGTSISFAGRASTQSAQVNLAVASGLTAGDGASLCWLTNATSSDVLYFTGCEL